MKRTANTSEQGEEKKQHAEQPPVGILDVLPRDPFCNMLGHVPAMDLLSFAMTCKLVLSYCQNVCMDELDVSMYAGVPRILQQIKSKSVIAHPAQFPLLNMQFTEKVSAVAPLQPQHYQNFTVQPVTAPLKELEVKFDYSGYFPALFAGVTGLKTLKFKWSGSGDSTWNLEARKILQNNKNSLEHLVWKVQEEDALLHEFLKECKNMQVLKIQCTRYTRESQAAYYQSFPLMKDLPLKEYKWKSCWVNGQSNQMIEHLPASLEKLDITVQGTHFFQNALVKSPNLPNLRQLKVNNNVFSLDEDAISMLNVHLRKWSSNFEFVEYLNFNGKGKCMKYSFK